MNKSFIKALQQATDKGIEAGASTMSLAVLITCENVLPDYISEEKLSEVFQKFEEELANVWAEAHKIARESNVDDASYLLVGHVDEIRRKRGMKSLDELINEQHKK